MVQKIEVEVKKYFAGLGYDGYSGKFPDGKTINIRLSKGVIADPKPKRIKVTVEWDEGRENNRDAEEVREE